jgi:hypothetical protein
MLIHHVSVNTHSLSVSNASSLFNALEFGIFHHVSVIARDCLEAVGELASWQAKQVMAGGQGLQAILAEQPTALIHFIEVVLNLIIFNEMSPDLIEPAANALLPLIASDQGNYMTLVNSLLMKQGDAVIRERLAVAFNNLMTDNGITLGLDRNNRKQFIKNAKSFIVGVRGFMRVK